MSFENNIFVAVGAGAGGCNGVKGSDGDGQIVRTSHGRSNEKYFEKDYKIQGFLPNHEGGDGLFASFISPGAGGGAGWFGGAGGYVWKPDSCHGRGGTTSYILLSNLSLLNESFEYIEEPQIFNGTETDNHEHEKITIDTIYQCPEGCSLCNSSIICSKCYDGYYLYNNSCYENCSSVNSHLFGKDGQCFECDPNCATCVGSATECLSCNSKYYLTSENDCQRCPEGCEECKSSSKCIMCTTGFIHKGDNCYCSKGYYSSNDRCQECDPICETCSGSRNNCTSCRFGQILKENMCINATQTVCLNCFTARESLIKSFRKRR
ncbi:hypothetical protein TVAG_027890 [Trichomonas vaginalis G3]|uniref:EGF-like domain-containing protein n=1 Tax=Trichomonas vaginalis (strain ATCC PRA-98 / G3) TaxID=412133 RepID=A2E528_TRIV3|nr:serine-type endopeptidase protein [Trichomonas vaginalis G3]EAY12236.1 hypothetical protein TVAG_027890 [Trichomonas vaginalis G3]KAI5536023.1 serine-type endopeptidase protein [Trichomonas vaginalis G3]|eukprot:XP_001324459.1 hypothetical protein [Trichomonas vaginalis G3]